MACDFRINFLVSKVILWWTLLTRSPDKVKCCICTYKVLYAIKLLRSELTYSVVNVCLCLVLLRGYLFPEVLVCFTDITLSEKGVQLMQIVNYTTWIKSDPSGEEDSHKVSINLLFVVNFYLALNQVQSKRSNLVDPASSHMLVSKIKPCMCKYKYCTTKLRMAH